MKILEEKCLRTLEWAKIFCVSPQNHIKQKQTLYQIKKHVHNKRNNQQNV
jgi:hypothetical protein